MFIVIVLYEIKKMPDEYLLKICIVGSTDLKTGWIRRFTTGKFTTKYLPILGVDITTKQIQVEGDNIKLILVDTAGQEFYAKSRPSYYRGASAAIIIFDKGERQSFDAIKGWIKEFHKHIPDQRVPIGLVGLITDTEEVTTKEGQALITKINMKYYESTTFPKGSFVEQVMIDLVKAVLYRPINQTFDYSKIEISDLIQPLNLDVKKISIIKYWGETAVGYCHYQCNQVPKSFLDNYKRWCGQKFIKYPKEHIQQCVHSCPLFNLVVDRRLAQRIIQRLSDLAN